MFGKDFGYMVKPCGDAWDLSFTKPPFWIGVENEQLCPIKEGPLTLKPSSLRLGTCH